MWSIQEFNHDTSHPVRLCCFGTSYGHSERLTKRIYKRDNGVETNQSSVFAISIVPMFLYVNRFVRFVSTPEILERVYTIESEILQIEEAISLQGNNDSGQGPVSIY